MRDVTSDKEKSEYLKQLMFNKYITIIQLILKQLGFELQGFT